MPRDGNDLEALQIHLCFCRSNLRPRGPARSGSTLVSAVSNIYLSQEAAGDLRRAEGALSRSLTESCFLKTISDGLDLSALHLPQKPHPLIPAVTHLFFLLLSFPLRAVDQCLIFLGFIFAFKRIFYFY